MLSEQSKHSVTDNKAVNIVYRHRRGRIIVILGLMALLLLVITLATSIGSVEVPFTTTFSILISKLPFIDITPDPVGNIRISDIETIVLDIRLPRVILAGVVGAALAVAGGYLSGAIPQSTG
jgi:iron complex transport system permease protein